MFCVLSAGTLFVGRPESVASRALRAVELVFVLAASSWDSACIAGFSSVLPYAAYGVRDDGSLVQ